MSKSKKTIVKKKKTKVKSKSKSLRGIERQGFANLDVLKSGSGRLHGSVNQSTLEIRTRLKELDCDPLEWAVKFLEGSEAPQSHPFLIHFKKFHKQLNRVRFELNKYKKEPPSTKLIDHLNTVLEEFQEVAFSMLGAGTWLDPKTRARIATELLSYIYPKQQSIEHRNNEIDLDTLADELTDQQLLIIAVRVLENKGDVKELESIKAQLSEYKK